MDIIGPKIKPETRTESSNVVNEFHLNATSASATKANVVDLIGVLDKTKNVGRLKKQLTTVASRAPTLEPPLSKSAQQKIERSVAYGQAKEKVHFWDEIVRQNRLADKINFPLKKIDSDITENGTIAGTIEHAVESFQPRTRLEIETEKLLKTSKNYLPPTEEYTEAEKEMLKALSLEEAEKRKSQLSKMRALISYKTAENKRKKAIKSKKYRRVQKKEKRKELEKEIAELMRSNNPREAVKKLELLELDRVAERSTLKHAGTGKWAKQIRRLAKKDPELRQNLQTQLRLGKELSEKLFARNAAEALDDQRRETDDEEADGDDEAEHSKPITKIDLTPKLAQLAENEDGDNDNQEALMAEAFEDDAVVADEDADEEEEGQSQDVVDLYDLSQQQPSAQMPGWNNWAGPGLLQKRRQNLKRMLAQKDAAAKKSAAVSSAINSRHLVLDNRHLADETIKRFMVKQTPFPFVQSRLFEENMTQPLGKEWNTQTSYGVLIEPSVRTKKGHVIEPMSMDHVRADKMGEQRAKKAPKQKPKPKRRPISTDADGNVKF